MVRIIPDSDIPKLSPHDSLDHHTTTTTSEMHILAVDDSIIDRKVVERLLKASGFKVTTAESGLKALDILGVGETPNSMCVNAFHINLILTDYCMPGMTGYDLLKRIKEASALKHIPVVVMSSDNVPSRIKRCLAEGAKEFILKPLQMSDVKRLRGHIYQTMLRTVEQPAAPACIKRKAPLETESVERRPRLDGVTVP